MSGPKVQLSTRPALAERAAMSWANLNRRSGLSCSVDTVQEKKNSAVYRIANAGPSGEDVIAKWVRAAPCAIERAAYQKFLPHVGIPAPKYFGSLPDETEGFHWIFIEQVHGTEYDSSNPSYRAAAARWLAELHSRSTVLGLELMRSGAMPVIGPVQSIVPIRAAMGRITTHMRNPSLADDDRAVLHEVLKQCQWLIDRSDRLSHHCERFPRTLVHGDFVPKNIRLIANDSPPSLVVFDWEMAGYGPSGPDVAECEDLPSYHAALSGAMCSLQLMDVQALSLIGKALRWAAAIDWASWGLEGSDVRKPMRNLRCYCDDMRELAVALRQAGVA